MDVEQLRLILYTVSIMQYRKDKHGKDISLLGYGCMRFTTKAGRIDLDKAEKEILAAVEAGVNYFDTAYIYTGSEAALGEIVEKNNLRSKINIATKLPQYLISNSAAIDKYFTEELSRLRTDYIDYYLMHHLTDFSQWERLKTIGIEEWIAKKKKSGEIRNIGFSFHGTTEMFIKILNDYDWDFCLVQYNYLDKVSQAGEEGVKALAAATPSDTGETAASWYYEIVKTDSSASIVWKNSHIIDGVPIAVILEYGHATRNGGYVPPHPYINQALKPIFEKIADSAWKEVTKG